MIRLIHSETHGGITNEGDYKEVEFVELSNGMFKITGFFNGDQKTSITLTTKTVDNFIGFVNKVREERALSWLSRFRI